MADLMFQNVAYRATVYRTGAEPREHEILVDQLNLRQPWGADYGRHIATSPPRFLNSNFVPFYEDETILKIFSEI